jgi:hypothetical protein
VPDTHAATAACRGGALAGDTEANQEATWGLPYAASCHDEYDAEEPHWKSGAAL